MARRLRDKKKGIPADPYLKNRVATQVTDRKEQMEKLKASGYTYSDAFRVGSRILSNPRLRDLFLEELELSQASNIMEAVKKADSLEEGAF